MVQHDNPDGPCACGAWHKPGDGTWPGARSKWSCPLHGDTIVRCCGQALRIGWGAGPEHKSYQCPCGSPVENHVPNGIHCRRGL